MKVVKIKLDEDAAYWFSVDDVSRFSPPEAALIPQFLYITRRGTTPVVKYKVYKIDEIIIIIIEVDTYVSDNIVR